MSVKGKKEWQWVARSLCDFGTPGRNTVLSRHYSLAVVDDAFRRLVRIYGDIHHWRVWQEDRKGNILNDNTAPDDLTPPDYAAKASSDVGYVG